MFEESMSIPAIWASMNSWFTPAVFFVLLNVMIVTIAVTSALGTQKPQQQTKDDPQQPHLARSPSVLQRLKSINLYPYIHRSQEPPTTTTVVTTFIETPHRPDEQEQTHEEEEEEEPTHELEESEEGEKSIDEVYSQLQDRHDEQEQTHEEEEEEEEEEPTHELEEGEEGEKSIDEVYSQLHVRHVSRSASDTNPASGEVPVKLSRKMKKSASAKLAFANFEEDDIVESRRPATVREGKAKATEMERDDEEVDAKADDFINKFRQQLKLQRLDSIIRYEEMVTGSGK